MKFEELLEITGAVTGKADEATLANYRLPGGLSFPPSYRQFCLELGHGLLCGLFMIYMPMADEQHPDAFQLQYPAMRSLFDTYLDPPLLAISDTPGGIGLIQNGVPFATSENGEFLFWDIRERLPDGEFPIYFTGFDLGIVHAGNSLFEFLALVTRSETFKSVLPFYTRPLEAVFRVREIG
ncbi:SMI1/KNR4 family protein [Pedobacter sp.]|jgi:hypothetical protein|uniref:SMI1/KNR4 family protein n=1 Tax=Pedobacter sp. TaxID=1411316 RepID=UPI002C55DF27|nr:SMI1/KNR4 family protein [Pedobacter sp.]HWW41500.1 SMI1/KNR4 family protein [Pedobacter sp.]